MKCFYSESAAHEISFRKGHQMQNSKMSFKHLSSYWQVFLPP